MDFLMLDEINALEHLRELSSQKWFNIRSPNYIWDSDNKVRIGVKDGIKEFLSCSESYIKDLTVDEKFIIYDLWNTVNETDFNFDEVNNE